MKKVFYNNKIYRVQQKKNCANDLYELYKYYLHNITAKWIDPLAVLCVRLDFTGTSPSDANTKIPVLYPICTAFSSLFLVCFMPKCSLLCFSGLFQRVLSCKCVIVCLFSCTHDTLHHCLFSPAHRFTHVA